MTTPKPEAKTVHSETYRAPVELFQRVNDFLEQATPALLAKIGEATIEVNGKPRTNSKAGPFLKFMDYAMWLALNHEEQEKPTPAASPRFGVRIEQDVLEIIAKNRAAYAENPAAWENLTAIGSTLLRAKGHNPSSIEKWFKQNKDMIAAHHAEVDIDKFRNEKILTAEQAILSHNRRAGKAKSFRK